MATPQGTIRQRNVGSKKKDSPGPDVVVEPENVTKALKAATSGSERDYKIVGVLITILAFLTRFWGISHPNEVVFDEVHFGKVRLSGSLLVSSENG